MKKQEKRENKKVILIVRDGWGYSKKYFGNMVRQAKTPWTDKMEKEYPTFLLKASGEAVGLPKGFAGNSEVGHITIGAGRKIEQNLTRIFQAIEDGSFFQNKAILHLIQEVKKNKSKLHLISILQKEGIHGHLGHLEALLKYARKEGLQEDDVVIHVFTDGRDAHPENAVNYLAELAEIIYQQGVGIVATMTGRYYGMDRNNHLDRTKKAYNAIFQAQGKKFDCGLEALEKSYQKGITDQFIKPLIKNGYQGVEKNDAVFFVNFRKDRARQLTKMILDKLQARLVAVKFASMTRYYREQESEVAFENIIPENTLGDILEEAGKKQLRISETEKFAHVTFFFDGGTRKIQKNRDDIIIPSPEVATYDLQPEMSTKKLTKKIYGEVETEKYDFILINFPNADMVGHTGNKKAAKKAIETVDKACQKITELALKKKYTVILTADHGNAEEMRGKNITAHSQNLVPTTIISPNLKLRGLPLYQRGPVLQRKFSLQNIGKTVLNFLNLEKENNFKKGLLER